MSGRLGLYLVLDAYGVIYQPGDDVEGTLIPFIAERGGSTDRVRIKDKYREASLGSIDSAAFWASVGLDVGVENEYLGRIRLVDGVPAFLAEAASTFAGVGVLSNDVSAWSRKLRERHGLTAFIPTWVISGEVGIRKPDAGIYRHLLDRLGVKGEQILFVDDRPANLDAAKRFGIRTMLMQPDGAGDGKHETARSLEEVLRWQNSRR